MHHSMLTHSPAEGYLDCCQIEAIMNKPAANIHIVFCVNISFRFSQANAVSGIAILCGK